MATEVLSIVVGMVLGLLTGFYFERRATRAAEAQNKELRHELDSLRSTVYSLGGDPDLGATDHQPPDLLTAVRTRALATQDATGRIRRREIIAHFVEKGANSGDVEIALAELCAVDFLREEGHWLQIR